MTQIRNRLLMSCECRVDVNHVVYDVRLTEVVYDPMSEEFIGSQISRDDVFVAFESNEMIICFTYTENGPPMKSKYH